MENNVNQLEKKVSNLDKLINEYTLLKGDIDNVGKKKSIEFFVSHMVKKKILLTGASGTVGKEVLKELLSRTNNSKE